MGTVLDDHGLRAAGRALESARLAAGRTLDQVAASLGVRLPYLEALESGEFGRILGPTYAESMIVRYAVHLGLNPESLLSEATKPLTEVSAQPAPGVPVSLETPAEAKSTPAAVGAPTSSPAAARRRTRARSGGWFDAVRARSPLFRVGIALVLVLAVVALGLFGAVQLGVLSLFDAGGAADADPANSVASASTGSATSVTAGSTSVVSTTGASVVTTIVTPATTVPTTTPSRPVTTQAPPAPVAFSLLLTAKEDVWVEFRDVASDETLQVGIIAKGDSVTLEADGPVSAVVGKPGALSLEVNGQTAEPPISYRWVIDSTGVEERP